MRERQRGPIYQRISYGYGTMPGFAHKLERGDLELLTDLVEAYRTESPRKVAGWRDDCERAAGAGRRMRGRG